MEFWVLWFIGIVIVIGTRIAINKLVRDFDVYNNNKIVQGIINLFVFICISIVGGIIVAKWIGNFADVDMSSCTITENIIGISAVGVLTIIGAGITYIVGFCILGLYHFDKLWLHICFLVVFIVSIIAWSIPVCNYNRNIESVTENILEQKQERPLLYFCNIPVQNISGTISGSSFIGIGEVSGNITTMEKLPYWYLNQNGEGVYESCLAKESKIVFIKDDESPYVEVFDYATKTTTINNNNGKEKIKTNKTWKEYIFYLPKSIMQYNLN